MFDNRSLRQIIQALVLLLALLGAPPLLADDALVGTNAVLRQLERAEARPSPRWQVLQTENYRILHMNASLAQRVAKIAERERNVLWRAWTGEEPPGHWPQTCDIYLYPTRHEMVAMTGGEHKAGSTLVRPSKLYQGKILSRRVDLTADDGGLLDSTLPHEVSHLVFGDLFGGKLPLWINEGAATMAEGPTKQRYYEHVLRRFRRERRLFQTSDLMQFQSYPEFPFGALFYAQSSALVAYLLSLADGPTFVEFVKQVGKHGHARAIAQVYGIPSLSKLHGRWLRFIQGS